ncbi:VOC family protein [Streptomyces sp. NPDC001714]|uniref:VOC family protein n=1 Tax=Streptomyces sp. NPDC001714 TaxID=3364603 RepID=UPI0036D1377C
MPAPFVFFDLRSTDVPTTRTFYEQLFGWKVTDTLITDQDGTPWGGVTALPPGDDRIPQWIPYVPVIDLDAATQQATELGATLLRPRTDLPQGSLTVISDPSGATLALWQSA